ncbi:MAG: DNA polymerase IV [Pseudomonadota bacterium]
MQQRKIIHLDMDAFYASVEQRDNPAYRNRPVIVGGDPQSRGVVAACSYPAREFGVHSAMPSAQAYRLCPEAIFVRPRFDVYREISQQIRELFVGVKDKIEPLSLDEAYLDVTGVTSHQGSATRIAQALKKAIFERTSLTSSAGVSYNKFFAKVASAMNKPDGLTVILPEQGEAFVARLPVGKFHGVGRVTEEKMQSLGIATGADLREWPLEELQREFGKSAQYYYDIARGIDNRPVEGNRQRQSIGAETTFESNLTKRLDMVEQLESLGTRVAEMLRSADLTARTVTIKVRYADFSLVTRSHSGRSRVRGVDDVLAPLPLLLEKTEAAIKPVRLLGVSVSGLLPTSAREVVQLSLL